MIADMVSLEATVLSFETVLKIEYEEQSAKEVVESSIKKLENAYGVRMQERACTIWKLRISTLHLL